MSDRRRPDTPPPDTLPRYTPHRCTPSATLAPDSHRDGLRSPLLWLTLVVLVLALLSLVTGSYPITLTDAANSVWQRLLMLNGADPSAAADPASTINTVLFDLRLPRTVAAITVGAALSLAGASFQTIFRNPLVSPDLLGVSAGAGLGAVLGIHLALPVVLVQGLAFGGGLAAVGLVTLLVALIGQRGSVLSLLLGGIVIGALAGACTSLLKVLADPFDQLPAMTFWLLGSLAAIDSRDLLTALPVVLIGLVPLIVLRWRINLLSLADDEAASLGVPVVPTRLLVIACATLITSAVVAIAGVIGWVGLVIPHMARMLVGPGFRRLLPASALLGAGYLLAVDTLARSVGRIEMPIGILTAIIGAPFFLWLLARGQRGWND